MAKIRKIMCCCGSGLGSSMMVQLNTNEALKKLGVTDCVAEHTSLSEVNVNSADLFVVGKDIYPQLKNYPRVLVLDKIMSKKELLEKLQAAFEMEGDEFHIGV
ncbi:MAG TPA: PTS sugar transporter subunit IIB [Erysipelotrichaceae bacterium]|jgi:PTS system ascorbate-specific IIB component|nr:PTS sugar transporter subunit IIB [Erysipelotrichaceae bacterium]HQB31937.1 PTS sugar transporter subunit IIB [Erysipelotrichaceae bacterium]